MTPKGKVLVPDPLPQPQPGPDFGPLTKSPAPRARSITATAAAAPVNNTPHPLRTGTSRVRHLTSGGAGRGGVDCTKCALHVAISPVLPGPRARSRDEQEMGRVVATKSAAGKGCPRPRHSC